MDNEYFETKKQQVLHFNYTLERDSTIARRDVIFHSAIPKIMLDGKRQNIFRKPIIQINNSVHSEQRIVTLYQYYNIS